MEIKHTVKNGIIILTPIDFKKDQDLEKVYTQVKTIATQQKNPKVIIDMSNITLINSTGIGILTACLATLKNAGGQLSLSNLHQRVKNVFRLTKLDTLFNIYHDIKSALYQPKVTIS